MRNVSANRDINLTILQHGNQLADRKPQILGMTGLIDLQLGWQTVHALFKPGYQFLDFRFRKVGFKGP